MGTTYEMQQEFEDMHALLTQDRFRCIMRGTHSLRNLQLPPLLRVKTFWVLVQAEDDWHEAEAWRLKGESFFESLPKTDETGANNMYIRAEMRAMLDQLRDRQWSSSKDETHPPAPYVEDEEEQITSRPDSANDGSYGEHTTRECHVASEAAEKASAEKAAAEDSAEVGRTMEETRLEPTDNTHRNEETVSPGMSEGKPVDGTKDYRVTRKTTVSQETTVTEEGGMTKKTVVSTETVVTWESF